MIDMSKTQDSFDGNHESDTMPLWPNLETWRQTGVAGRSSRKQLGAYYTDSLVAHLLVKWVVQTGQELVLDPGFGGGVFLDAASARIRALGGDPQRQVYGIEVEESAYREYVHRAAVNSAQGRFFHASLFDVESDWLPAFDAVVGNPPFIRYQRFTGEQRQAALRRATQAGARLNGMVSSWAPFLVYSCELIRQGGRLAMVAPAELAYAAYAKPVIDYLQRNFRTTHVFTFAERLFPDLSEDTVLVLASGRSEPFDSFRLIDTLSLADLSQHCNHNNHLELGTQVDANAIRQGHERFTHYLLPATTRDLYSRLKASPFVRRLGKVADAGIGYVTGDNDFFHVNHHLVSAFGLPSDVLRPAVRSGGQLAGLRFTHRDWDELHSSGHANLLLHIPPKYSIQATVRAYLEQGIRSGVPSRFKCKVRQPWYSVPHVYEGDAFLTYMANRETRLVANEAAAVAPNTLHVIRLLGSQGEERCPNALQLACLWQTSLTLLSCELEGHSLGGGMLKLEPTEAENVLVAVPSLSQNKWDELPRELDRLLRTRSFAQAHDVADAVILRDGAGLSRDDVEELRYGAMILAGRRLNR